MRVQFFAALTTAALLASDTHALKVAQSADISNLDESELCLAQKHEQVAMVSQPPKQQVLYHSHKPQTIKIRQPQPAKGVDTLEKAKQGAINARNFRNKVVNKTKKSLGGESSEEEASSDDEPPQIIDEMPEITVIEQPKTYEEGPIIIDKDCPFDFAPQQMILSASEPRFEPPTMIIDRPQVPTIVQEQPLRVETVSRPVGPAPSLSGDQHIYYHHIYEGHPPHHHHHAHHRPVHHHHPHAVVHRPVHHHAHAVVRRTVHHPHAVVRRPVHHPQVVVNRPIHHPHAVVRRPVHPAHAVANRPVHHVHVVQPKPAQQQAVVHKPGAPAHHHHEAKLQDGTPAGISILPKQIAPGPQPPITRALVPPLMQRLVAPEPSCPGPERVMIRVTSDPDPTPAPTGFLPRVTFEQREADKREAETDADKFVEQILKGRGIL